ncbi:aminoglycoside 3-N-acetyltransferase [Aurantimicrobium minutum]|uniref:AAC(3) family N-acetyltransferase n=1 Tax=Aurantimicrobium minutum TaxID=708131 RepID=UPI0024052B4C|nr:AAC(3) family N-acetyltransferase [Aurantimicrobium minutum]MDF9810728.1 aminoglycoside 3-N-acetyltransferase [Aurantimicrobium minutum]
MTHLLFEDAAGNKISTQNFNDAFTSVEAHDAEILYIHSGLTFGKPNNELRPRQLLQELDSAIQTLDVPTLAFPTFTFSFCNGLDFDIQNSKSQMGALNEFVRKDPAAVRSNDPLMSVVVRGDDKSIITDLGKSSIGENSTFDKLSRKNKVKFMFLGVELGDCFTYMHYLEWVAKSAYRYDREFTGKVIDNGSVSTQTYELFVRYNGVFPNRASYQYGDYLEEKGFLKRAKIGDSFVSVVDLEPASEIYLDWIKRDPNCFITEPFVREQVDTEFNVENMVAL